MSGTLVSFMAMAIGGRELSDQLSTFQILFFRSVIGLMIVCFFLWRSNWRQVITKNFRIHGLRNIAHFGGQFGWFYGIAFIPLAEVFALEFTVPVWTAVLATVLLGEHITRERVTAIAFGVVGVLLILRPGLAVVNPASLAVLGGAFCYAFSHTLTRKLALVDTPLAILFYCPCRHTTGHTFLYDTYTAAPGLCDVAFRLDNAIDCDAAMDHCSRRRSFERPLLHGTSSGNSGRDCRGATGLFEITPDCRNWCIILRRTFRLAGFGRRCGDVYRQLNKHSGRGN
jgi:uncharacterized membrane protein